MSPLKSEHLKVTTSVEYLKAADFDIKRQLPATTQAHTFVNVLEADTGIPRDCLPAAMDDGVGWRKRAVGVD